MLATWTFILFVVFVCTGLTPPALVGGSGNDALASGGSSLSQVVLTGFVMLSLATLLMGKRGWRAPALSPFIVAVLLLCWASLGWSEFPSFALRRVLALTFGALVVGSLVSSLDRREVPRLFAYTLGGLLLLNLMSVLVLPGAVEGANALDPTSSGGGWRGLVVDKNMAGAITAPTVIAGLFMLFQPGARRREYLLWFTVVLLGLVFEWRTGSKTSLGLLPVVVLLGLVFVGLAQAPRLAGVAALVFMPALLLLWFSHADWSRDVGIAFERMLQDPRSFTGRSQIWNVVLEEYRKVPWLGQGYGSFWLTGEGGPIARLSSGYLFWLRTVPNSHSGYFDMLIQIGGIGLIMAVIAAILLPLVQVITYPSLDARTRWLVAANTLFFAFHNFLETSLFEKVNALWILQLTLLALLRQYRHDDRSRRIRSG